MADFSLAINLIRKYEGFNEKAYPDHYEDKEPYTIGYGTQFYPDGSPVRKGQRCTKEKALEFLFNEIEVINNELIRLNLPLDEYMRQALISFIHSVGWESFLYSQIIDCIENENFGGVCEDIGRWIFDEEYQVIGGLLDRRKEEIKLFLTEIHINDWKTSQILLNAFNTFKSTPGQIRAIQKLEESINPYILSDFANGYKVDINGLDSYAEDDFMYVSVRV
jgi:GH24 family phage-related lysozyme (muramidase)|tara:strand:+ start:5157 stop:5819 length:663 start_codon:yes stop_codon:yes gene_type:complete